MNLRPLGYEPNELPDCSTPHLNGIARGVDRQEFRYQIEKGGMGHSVKFRRG